MLAGACKVVFSMAAMQRAALSSWALNQLPFENIAVVGVHSRDITWVLSICISRDGSLVCALCGYVSRSIFVFDYSNLGD